MENNIFELQYALDTFYFLVCGALVMWMAAGFAMLEAGLVRSKNTTEILTKNVALFAVSCIMYMVSGYAIMYGGDFYCHLADLQSYIFTQQQVSELYANPQQWAEKAILNVARVGKFSSDRTIEEYATEIWNLKSVTK